MRITISVTVETARHLAHLQPLELTLREAELLGSDLQHESEMAWPAKNGVLMRRAADLFRSAAEQGRFLLDSESEHGR